MEAFQKLSLVFAAALLSMPYVMNQSNGLSRQAVAAADAKAVLAPLHFEVTRVIVADDYTRRIEKDNSYSTFGLAGVPAHEKSDISMVFLLKAIPDNGHSYKAYFTKQISTYNNGRVRTEKSLAIYPGDVPEAAMPSLTTEYFALKRDNVVLPAKRVIDSVAQSNKVTIDWGRR